MGELGSLSAGNAERLDGDALLASAGNVDRIATAAKDVCLPVFEKIKGAVNVYNFKHRLKGAPGIHRKVLRKRLGATVESPEYNYNPKHVTDAWGCRFVTLFQGDIIDVCREIVKHLCHEDSENKSPFERHGLQEVNIYTNRPDNDPLSISEAVKQVLRQSSLPESIVNAPDIVRKPENKKSAYSSVHFIVRIPVRVELTGVGIVNEVALIEIQIRDIFEEAWGEVQHRLVYSGKDDLTLQAVSAQEKFWMPHLNGLKVFVDGCSQYANLIKKHAVAPISSVDEAPAPPVNAPEDEKTRIIGCLPLRVEDDVRLAIENAYDILIAAKEVNDEDSSVNYGQIADAFQVAYDKAEMYRDLPCCKRNLGYHLMMEKAWALTLAATSDPARGVRDEVFSIYDSILERYPTDVTALYRRSWATHRYTRDRASLEKALQYLKEAAANLPSDDTIRYPHWLYVAIPLTSGYIYWTLARLAEPAPERKHAMELFTRAVEFNEKARHQAFSPDFVDLKEDVVDWQQKCIANALYFIYDECMMSTDDNIDMAIETLSSEKRTILAESVQALNNAPLKRVAEENLATCDSLMCAQWLLGDYDAAKEIAIKNLHKLYNLVASRKNAQFIVADDEIYYSTLQSWEYKCYENAMDATRWLRRRQSEGSVKAKGKADEKIG